MTTTRYIDLRPGDLVAGQRVTYVRQLPGGLVWVSFEEGRFIRRPAHAIVPCPVDQAE